MRRERVEPPKPQGAESAVDNLLWLAVGTALAATVLVWVVGQLAAVLFGAHHWLPLSLAQVAQVPFHLAKHPGDPKLAWPISVRGMLPGPVGMYARRACVLSSRLMYRLVLPPGHLVEQRGHDLRMQIGLIRFGRAECCVKEVDRRHRPARLLDVGGAEESILGRHGDMPHPHPGPFGQDGRGVNDRSGANAHVVAERRSLKQDRSGGHVAVRADLATGQHAQRRHQRSLADADGKGGPAPTADRADDRPGEHDRLVGDLDRRAAALDHDPVVHIRTGADLHVAHDMRGQSDPRAGVHARRPAVPLDQHLRSFLRSRPASLWRPGARRAL
jgi:hypothetical protein